MTSPHYHVAMFGAGRIGNVHGRNIAAHSRTSVKYIVDPVEAPARNLAAELGATYTDEATALNDPDVAAIVVCSATSTHAELIERAWPPARRCSARSRSTSTSSASAKC
jgi:myo-inositol 2-dehydrogenase / D-chiro-inositol 1-dehydrogenase